MNNLLKGLPASVRQTLVAVFPLLVIIILFVFAGEFGISKIEDIRSRIKVGEGSQAALTQKLSILRTYSQTASNEAGVTLSAFPADNPSLAAISQLKVLAASGGVTLSSIKTGSSTPGESGLNGVTISFTVTGTMDQIISFLNSTTQVAPIIVLGALKFTENTGIVGVDVSATSFWSPLPATIPTLNQPINDLTSGERDILSKVTALSQPTFTTQTSATAGTTNTNPFGE